MSSPLPPNANASGASNQVAKAEPSPKSIYLERKEVQKTVHPASVVPRIGTSAIIYNKQGQILMGRRLKSHGANSWQFPGGHLDLQELTFNAAAEREVHEETGLRVKATEVGPVTNDLFWDGDKNILHYCTVFVKCEVDYDDGDTMKKMSESATAIKAPAKESEKCAEWVWQDPNKVENAAKKWKDSKWWDTGKARGSEVAEQPRDVCAQKYYAEETTGSGEMKPMLPIVNLFIQFPNFSLETFSTRRVATGS